jgi:hypothetical protein
MVGVLAADEMMDAAVAAIVTHGRAGFQKYSM